MLSYNEFVQLVNSGSIRPMSMSMEDAYRNLVSSSYKDVSPRDLQRALRTSNGGPGVSQGSRRMSRNNSR